MKSTDERMSEVLGRARARKAATWRRRQRAVALGGGTISVLAIVAIGIGLASVGPFGEMKLSGPFGLMGSVFAGGSTLGYVAVGLIGLMLGIAVTMLVYKFGRKAELADKPQISDSEAQPADSERPEQ